MSKSFTLTLTFLSILFSNQVLADRENDMWQQFKAQKAMNELDAQFNKPEPEPRVVKRIVERPAPQPAPVVVAAPVTAPALAPVSQPSMVTVESEGYIFKLGSCRLAHRNIKCPLMITSVDTDGDLTLYGTTGGTSSRLFDHNGNEYQPSTITMGNKSHSQQIRNRYISGVLARGNIEFVNVDSSTTSVSMFELSIHNYATGKYNKIQFRDVSLNL